MSILFNVKVKCRADVKHEDTKILGSNTRKNALNSKSNQPTIDPFVTSLRKHPRKIKYILLNL